MLKGTETEKNLLKAFAGESQARNKYTYFARIAKDGGFEEIAKSFEEIAKVERFHEHRYRKLIENIKNGEVFARKEVKKWHCRNCGYIHEGIDAPKECPACKHPRSYYELLVENF